MFNPFVLVALALVVVVDVLLVLGSVPFPPVVFLLWGVLTGMTAMQAWVYLNSENWHVWRTRGT
jgi:hypothetical protein